MTLSPTSIPIDSVGFFHRQTPFGSARHGLLGVVTPTAQHAPPTDDAALHAKLDRLLARHEPTAPSPRKSKRPATPPVVDEVRMQRARAILRRRGLKP